MADPATYRHPQMEPCSRCGGHGLITNAIGEADDCPACGGGGLVEARDERGRFLPWTEHTDDG
jgi:DnaJ-class molecular chaperone